VAEMTSDDYVHVERLLLQFLWR